MAWKEYDNSNNNLLRILAILKVMKSTASFGNTQKTNGSISVTLTGNDDELLTPPDNPQPVVGGDYNGYKQVTGLTAIKEGGYITVEDDALVIGAGGDGDYSAPMAWVDFSANARTITIGLIYVTERDGLYYFSQRPVGVKIKEINSLSNLSAGGHLSLQEGDKVTLWIAADEDVTVSIHDANLGLNMDISDTLAALVD